jgi:HD-GYP domain-containing protein (c-di-GMP phosphodiesterase class II)
LDLAQRLIKIGKLLSLEKSIRNVFRIILDEVMYVTSADRGVIYITSEDKTGLKYERVKTVSLEEEYDADQAIAHRQTIELFEQSGEPIMNSLATFVYHTGFEAHFDDIYEQDYFQIELTKHLDNRENYHSKSMLAVPLVDHEEQVLGIIELTNCKDGAGEIVPFSEDHIEILLSVSSQVAITLSNKLLIRNLERMIFEFTQSIAYAIDMKSVNTYQHVQKVTILTNFLANAINEVDIGAYAETFFTDDELDELTISGWLHDLGKIVTSSVLLNKSTKLVSCSDRTKIIGVKFELLEQVIHNLFREEISLERRAELQKLLEKLPRYYKLICQINQGSESVSEEVITSLKEISEIEVRRNGKVYSLLDEDELENLLIPRGTLTSAEYNEIKKHAEITYNILNKITFPGKYRNVARIASSHHERMNGTGYPQGLKNGEILLQSRILAIADVFDALMPKRSYKASYSLNNSLKILADMARREELDKDLMDILLDRKIYYLFAGEYDVKDFSEIEIEEIKKIYRG